ncbi:MULTISPECIES: hypothetical protein [Methylobacterium]|uniref:hypothetical protein n=1 Tax=Methylobacterium TaxID=407 RepID=UPI00272E0A3C|nr:hypothetical protein [Methylobacterium sp.]
MGDLREEVQQGTLQRMQEALARVDAKMEEVRAERHRLAASIREVEGLPSGQEEALLAIVRLHADGELVVSAPGSPPHRIVAIREKLPWAAAQRVAELVNEALQARGRSVCGER